MVALDAKISFDDNALFRHPELEKLHDEGEEDPKELEAAKYNLNYVALDGNIGCLVNGAGLAMATMDIIKLYGAAPANFLDVGGGATKERVTAAFKIILSDPNVEGILVNIFGGIMRCDVIAEGVVAAAREVKLSVPLVVRLEGTNVQLGKEILAKSNLPIIAADNLADAAEKIVRGGKGGDVERFNRRRIDGSSLSPLWTMNDDCARNLIRSIFAAISGCLGRTNSAWFRCLASSRKYPTQVRRKSASSMSAPSQ